MRKRGFVLVSREHIMRAQRLDYALISSLEADAAGRSWVVPVALMPLQSVEARLTEKANRSA